MVLRFSCPCGAPYALADHLAGRVFKCTQCGRALKIGTPAPPPPTPAVDPDQLMASMEWSSERLAPPPPPPSGMPAARARPPADDGDLDLLPDDDDEGLMNSMEVTDDPDTGELGLAADEEEEEDEDDEEDEAPPRGSRRGRRASGQGRTSGQGRSSKRASARTSAGSARSSARASKRSSGGGPVEPASHSRQCPVCDATIARIAAECPSCGVVLRGPSAASRAGAAVKNYLAPLAGVVVVLGIAIYTYKTLNADDRRKPVVVSAGKQADGGSSGEAGAVTPPKDGAPQDGDAPKDDAPKDDPPKDDPPQDDPPQDDPPKDDPPQDDPPQDDPPQDDPPKDDPPKDDPPKDDPPQPPRPKDDPPPGGPSDQARSETAHVPAGPLAPAFERLRDASPEEVEAAIDALAASEGAAAAIAEAKKSSLDGPYVSRLHRAGLRVGDEAARRAAIEASLAEERHDLLVATVVAALDLDADGFRAQLQRIPLEPETFAGRSLADALLDRSRPSASALEPLRRAHEQADAATRALLLPLLALAGDSQRLLEVTELIDHGDARCRDLARWALKEVSAGLGPGEEASAAEWREWVRVYQPLRELLLEVCDPSVGAARQVEAKRAAIGKGADILRALAVFVRDPAARGDPAGLALGDLIARVGRTEHAAEVQAILSGLEGRGAGAVAVVAGALLACDGAVAEAAARALMRVGAAPEDHALIPDLNQPASSAAAAELLEWARGLPDRSRADALKLVASFRPDSLADQFVAGGVDVEARARNEVGARLGSAKIERALLDVLEDGKASCGVSDYGSAVTLLGQVGTSAAVNRLLKLYEAGGHGHSLAALVLLVGPEHGRKLKKLAATAEDKASEVFLAYGLAAGPEAGSTLEKRWQKQDRHSPWAKTVLLDIGAPEGRDAAAEPFKNWVDSNFARGHPPLPDIRKLVRCGKPADGQYLVTIIERQTRADQQTLSELILGIAEMRYAEGRRLIDGYVFPGHPQRGDAAVALAIFGATDAADRVKNALAELDLSKKVHPEDMVVLACLGRLSPEKGGAEARRMLEAKVLAGATQEHVASMAFALTWAEDQASLRALLEGADATARHAVALGIALAAAAARSGGAGTLVAPAVLEDLRVDPEPAVRAEAAVARALLGLDGASWDVALAVHWPDPALDGKRPAHKLLMRLARCSDAAWTLRGALWEAYEVTVRGQTLRMRDKLGLGRFREHQRDMRAKR